MSWMTREAVITFGFRTCMGKVKEARSKDKDLADVGFCSEHKLIYRLNAYAWIEVFVFDLPYVDEELCKTRRF